MKKIYSKFTKERTRIFQIETAIYLDDNKKRYVGKRAIYPEGENHIYKMFSNYSKDTNKVLTHCEMNGKEVLFPFVEGENYYNILIGCFENKDKDGVMRILKAYKELIYSLYAERIPFLMTKEFESVFGNIKDAKSYEAAVGINIDLTLDNIVLSADGPKIIDYEWIFDFPIPIKFPIYRAVFALYIKHGTFISDMMSLKEMYAFYDISEKDTVQFAQMNGHFNAYVENGDLSYNNVLKKYEKDSWDIARLIPDKHYLQIYYDMGTGYSEENSERIFLDPGKQTYRIRIEKEWIQKCRSIRIDPLECPFAMRMQRLEIEAGIYFRKLNFDELQTNAEVHEENYWIFDSSDPQVIVPIPNEENWDNLILEYEVIVSDKKGMGVLKSYKNRELQHIEQYQQLLAYHENEMNEVLRRELLLKEKLSYIESSKIYQKLLQKKVESVRDWT